MILSKLIGLLITLKSLLCPCVLESHSQVWNRNREEIIVERIGTLSFPESSGLAFDNAGKWWTLQDGRLKGTLLQIDSTGSTQQTIHFGFRNWDWEAMAHQPDGTMYIGDIGNNTDWRQEIAIIRIRSNKRDTLKLRYPRSYFHPQKPGTQWDAEALYWAADTLTMISKSRGSQLTRVYRIPTEPWAAQELQPTQRLSLKSGITGADISPNGLEVAAIAYGKLYIFDVGHQHLLEPKRCYWWPFNGQAEAIMYLSQNELLVSNEAGKLWKVTLPLGGSSKN